MISDQGAWIFWRRGRGRMPPDLIAKISAGAVLFMVYYAIFLLGLEWSAPGYIERVWNLPALSGLSIAGLPIEELLFATAFGAYWSSVYEHFTWQRLAHRHEGVAGGLCHQRPAE
jgi:hypothetical protein